MSCEVIIIGAIHHNTLGVIRSLGEAGINPQAITVLLENGSKESIISKSKYLNKNSVICLRTSEEIVNWLLSNKNPNSKPTIICCSDSSAEMVIKNSSVLSEWYHTPSTKLSIENLERKDYQNKIANECGLKIPESIVINTRQREYCWDVFPCITKPVKSVEGSGKADIFIANNKLELDRIISNVGAEYIEIQKYITKKMEYQLIGCSMNCGDVIIIPGFTNIIRQPHNTNTGYLIYSPINDLRFDFEAVKTFIKKIGYSGLFSIEFLRDESGNDYFLEINMRNDGNAYCVQSAGINLPFIWHSFSQKEVIPNSKLVFTKPIHFMPELSDFRIGVESVGIIKWFRQFAMAESHALFSFHDMKPFVYELGKYIKRKFKRR